MLNTSLLIALLIACSFATKSCNMTMTKTDTYVKSKSCNITSSKTLIKWCNYGSSGLHKLTRVSSAGMIDGQYVSDIYAELKYDGNRFSNYYLYQNGTGKTTHKGSVSQMEIAISAIMNKNITCYKYDNHWYIFADPNNPGGTSGSSNDTSSTILNALKFSVLMVVFLIL